MNAEHEQNKRETLNNILIELSKSQDILKDAKNKDIYFKKLESVYYNCDEENFRHYYSDIFSTLTLIDGDSSIGSLDILAQNIQVIKDAYIPRNYDKSKNMIDISKEILKLYDHTNLDIARINYTKEMTDKTKSELTNNKLSLKSIEDDFKEAKSDLTELAHETTKNFQNIAKEVQDKQAGMQKEYITILGIFAAIVLAFTGGTVFSSSVLENINKPSIYRITLIALIIGFVLFNLICLLIDFVYQINGKNERKKWFIVFVNCVFIIGIVGVCLAYAFKFFFFT